MHFVFCRSDTRCVDDVAQELHRRLAKHRLIWVYSHTVLVETFEQLSKMLLVFIRVGTRHQQVVDVGIDKVKAHEDLVNETLESLGCVS